MRACFLGQNVCALGHGVATLQVSPLSPPAPEEIADQAAAHISGHIPGPPAFPALVPASGQEHGQPLFHPFAHLPRPPRSL